MTPDMATLLASTDGLDPLVVVLTWGLVAAVKRLAKKRYPKIRHILPFVAVLLAIGLRAAAETMQGADFSTATLLHGLSAAGLAVLLHSQIREVGKARQSKSGSVDPNGGARFNASAPTPAELAALKPDAEPLGVEDRPVPSDHAMTRPKDVDHG